MENLRDQIIDVVIKVMKSNLAPSDVVGKDLIHEFGISSVDALEILVMIESKFNITIDDNDLSQELVSSLDNLINYVRRRLEITA